MKRLICAILATIAALSAPSAFAQPAQLPNGQCLQQNRVYGWKVIDDRTLIVTDRSNRQYKVSLAPGCRDLKWPMRLGFSAGTGFGLSCVERHSFLLVPPNGPDIAQRCLIEDVQPYGGPTQASR
jgi:hypothetical protein